MQVQFSERLSASQCRECGSEFLASALCEHEVQRAVECHTHSTLLCLSVGHGRLEQEQRVEVVNAARVASLLLTRLLLRGRWEGCFAAPAAPDAAEGLPLVVICSDGGRHALTTRAGALRDDRAD